MDDQALTLIPNPGDSGPEFLAKDLSGPKCRVDSLAEEYLV